MGKDYTSTREELSVPMGPITRLRAKKLKFAFQSFVGHSLKIDLVDQPWIISRAGSMGRLKKKTSPST